MHDFTLYTLKIAVFDYLIPSRLVILTLLRELKTLINIKEDSKPAGTGAPQFFPNMARPKSRFAHALYILDTMLLRPIENGERGDSNMASFSVDQATT